MGAQPYNPGQADPAGAVIYSELGADHEVGDLVTLFVDELPQRTQWMEECYRLEDWDSLQRAAHQLKGAVGSYGFHPLTPHLLCLEQLARGGGPRAEIRTALDVVRAQCERVRAGAAPVDHD